MMFVQTLKPDVIVLIGNFILTYNFQRQLLDTDNIKLTDKTGTASIVTPITSKTSQQSLTIC